MAGLPYGETMYMILVWEVSRTGGRGGLRLTWEEETGWAYAKLGLTWAGESSAETGAWSRIRLARTSNKRAIDGSL
ncbi:hypothetical protein [Streptomyces sp. NPDC002088]|uniref:hypothetical protein n=1 Tax=Streptomyces sp. NPDC002088 TaxID=3154665 RepID=UPI00331E20AF